MEEQLIQIREQQKRSWNKFSSGWKKWDTFNMNFLRPMGNAIIESIAVKDGDAVLDVATGTGEPGTTIAAMTPNGKVTGTDLSEDMLIVARENAEAAGLKNYKTLFADICELPMDDEAFDAVSCRMGFMFFPDMQQAANEMYRVLKPGGRIATSVWAAPEANNWVTTIMTIIQKHVELTPPPAGSPGMFRCAKPGTIASVFEKAGFKSIREKIVSGTVDYGTFDTYWEMMLDVGAPIVAALEHADHTTRTQIKKEVAELFSSRNPDGKGILNFSSLIISAEK